MDARRVAKRFIVLGGVLPVVLALATTRCSGASAFCDQYCSEYTDCVDSGKYESSSRPLFCGLREPTRHETCVDACRQSVDRLGESEGAFGACANCAVNYLGEDACSDSAAEDIATTSCSSSCASAAAGKGADAFRKAFHASFDPKDSKSCSRTGTVTFPANDSRLGHKVGAEGSGGTWVCTSDCSYSHMMYGPYVGLPAGRYEAGFRGLHVGGTIPTQAIELDVVCSDGSIVDRLVLANEIASDLDVTFTLSQTKDRCEVRLLLLGSGMTASVASAHFTRF